jgi:hypothetical protein
VVGVGAIASKPPLPMERSATDNFKNNRFSAQPH